MGDKLVPLIDMTTENLTAYGYHVVEQRAVPDYRDGLKPVQRCILWAMYCLSLSPTGRFSKSARTVGDVIGKYHPHGDSSVYQAMVGLAGVRDDTGKTWVGTNSAVPLVEGYGNFGDNIDGAAAYRYTEARLSDFSWKYLLDPVYLAVSEQVDNFDGTQKMPLLLPAKLPTLLLNGSSSIAFGISASCPSFDPAGVIELVKLSLAKGSVDYKDAQRLLKFRFAYGGQCVSSKEVLHDFFKFGKSTLDFLPSYKVDPVSRTITVTSYCPGFTSRNSVDKLVVALRNLKEVSRVSDSTDKSGFRLEIVAQRSIKAGEAFDALVDLVRNRLVTKFAFDIGVITRTAAQLTAVAAEQAKVEFRRATVSQIVNEWCDWRVEMELRALNYLQEKADAKKKRLELLVLAVDQLQVIIESLSKTDSAGHISKRLRISLEDANSILDMRVRQLKKLERTRLIKEIKEVDTYLRGIEKDKKDPEARIVRDLDSIKIDF